MSEYEDNDIVEQIFNDENINIENITESTEQPLNKGLTEKLSESVREINDCKCDILNGLHKLYESIKYNESVANLLKSVEILTEEFQNFACDCLDELQEINSKYGDIPHKIVTN